MLLGVITQMPLENFLVWWLIDETSRPKIGRFAPRLDSQLEIIDV